MRELAFAGLTDAGELLLTSGDGQQYSLPVDERLVAAVRGDRPRLGQLSIALEGATPRDIQTRVRHGQSPEQISEQTGIALERVERFSGPPLAEREHVAARARATEVRRPEGDAALAELVLAVLAAGGIDDKTLEWDSWRREDGPWSVVATWAGGTDDLAAGSATWTFDNADRSLAPDDAAARVLLGGTAAEPEPAPRMRLVLADDGADDLDGPASPWGEPSPAEVDRQARAPWGDEPDPDAALTAVVDRYSGEVLDLAAGPPEEPDTPLDDLLRTQPGVVRAHAKASRRDRRKGARGPARTPPSKGDVETGSKARAVVPSWDEILFGAKDPED